MLVVFRMKSAALWAADFVWSRVMKNQQRKFYILILLCLILTFSHVYRGISLGASLSLDVKESLINLKAEDVPLIDVLKAISIKTELSIKLDDTITERISCEFKGVSLEKVIQQLLKKRSYAIGYREVGDNRFVPSEVWIVSGSNFQSLSLSPSSEDAVKKYQKDWFKREFAGEDRLADLISTTPSPVTPDGAGILITRVSEDSLFQKIGLKEGDLIHDVNGKAITTVRDFIQILKSVSTAEEPHLMISLRRSDNSTHPIYIRFY